jgi:predicted ester cyclase
VVTTIHARIEKEEPMAGASSLSAEAGPATQVGETLLRRFYDVVVNGGDLTAAEAMVTPNFVDHVPHAFPVQPTTGAAALTWLVSRLRTAFPDLSVTVDDVLAAPNRAVARVTWSGTHTGELMGTTPTNRPIRITGFDMVRIEDGRFAEHWGQVDVLGLIEQLGYLPDLDGSLR